MTPRTLKRSIQKNTHHNKSLTLNHKDSLSSSYKKLKVTLSQKSNKRANSQEDLPHNVLPSSTVAQA